MSQREVFMVNDPDQYVGYREYRIGLFEDFDSVKGTRKEPKLHKRGLEFTFFTEQLYLWISRYSAGDDLETLEGFLIMDVLPALEEYGNTDNWSPFNLKDLEEYILALWTISLCELFDLDEYRMDPVLKTIGCVGKDALIDRILGSRTRNLDTTAPLNHAHIWLPLFEALDFEGMEQQKSIQDFLRNWYRSMEPLWWHDFHMANNAGFFGYWTFELAALVRNLKLGDEGYADNLYYPRDLTGRKLLPTWLDSEAGEAAREEVFQQQQDAKYEPSPEKITEAQEQAEKAIREFMQKSVQGGSDEEGEALFAEAKNSLNFLSEAMGIDASKLEEHPEAIQALIVQMMGSTVNILEEHQKAEGADLTFMEPVFMEAYKNMEEQGISTEDILKELPPELLDQFGGLNEREVKVALSEKMAGFTRAMDGLLKQKDLSPEELFQGLEKMAVDLGYDPEEEPEDPTKGIQEDVSKRLGERLDKNLKTSEMFDFSFDDLWENKEE